ncbi:hypothetical protein J7E62_30900 [Variovorax paradoxus]|nr:hypothetical protein [Variovorax paradoxus]
MFASFDMSKAKRQMEYANAAVADAARPKKVLPLGIAATSGGLGSS